MEKTNGMVPVDLQFLDWDKRGHFWVRAYIRKSDRDILLEKENNADLGYLSALDLNPPKRKRRPKTDGKRTMSCRSRVAAESAAWTGT